MNLIGPYIKSFYFRHSEGTRILIWFKSLFYNINICSNNETSSETEDNKTSGSAYSIKKPFDKQEMLRDIFLWSVYAGYSDIAFVILLQLESRISAALIAARIARHLSLQALHLDLRHTFDQQAEDYEKYATACITACYKQNEKMACQLLTRENALFGEATCMQVCEQIFQKFVSLNISY